MKYLSWLLFSYKGRINRKTFYRSGIPICLLCGACIGILDTYSKSLLLIPVVVLFLITGYTIIPIIAKRLHDTGWNTEQLFESVRFRPSRFIIAVCSLIVICIFHSGTDGENKFGLPPN